MIPVQDSPNEYEISGLFADVWHALQVDLKRSLSISLSIYKMNVLQKELNFTYVVQKPASNSFGRKQDNGTWIGLFGSLARREIDVGE